MIRPNYKDYRKSQFIIDFDQSIKHSAKGSTWEEHKYIKRIDGTYYYPDSYKGGRHLPEGEKENDSSDNDDVISKLEDMTGMKRESLLELRDLSLTKGYESSDFKEMLDILSEGDESQAKKMVDLLKQDGSELELTSEDIENLAREVIRGNFGNGQERKNLLGEKYSEIQNRVNEILKGPAGSKKVTEATDETIKKVEEAAKKVTEATDKSAKESKVHSGVDMDRVLNVYRNKK